MPSTNEGIPLFSVALEIYASDALRSAKTGGKTCANWLRPYGIQFEPDRKPSIALARIFNALKKYRILTATIRPVSKQVVIVSAQISLRIDPAYYAAQVLVEGSDALRDILWHYFNQTTEEPMSEDEITPTDDLTATDAITATNTVGSANDTEEKGTRACGFVGCSGLCISGSVQMRNLFHLDRVFDECANNDPSEAFVDENHAMNIVNASLGINDRLSRLPKDVHSRIIGFLSAADVESLGKTCNTFEAATRHFVPGLKLSLYPHQKIALDRMRQMEQKRSDMHPMPMIRRLPITLTNGRLIVTDMCDGSLFVVDKLPLAPSPRGGLICDEPGLGKTITGLALILKTLGQRASPPAGYEERFIFNEYNGDYATFSCYSERSESRFTAYGDASLVPTPPRQSRILVGSGASPDSLDNIGVRRSNRRIRYTRFLESDKGRGALPMARKSNNIIYLSSATLVLAPGMLVKHWETQIAEHTTPGALKVLVVRKSDEIPDELTLAREYDVIIISFRIMNQLYHEMRKEKPPSILLVRFIRVIMDEGHKLGGTTELKVFPRVCASLKAERRWIMSGTPTPSTPNSDVKHLRPLLQFIGEETFGLDANAWLVGIQRPYEAFKPEALKRLIALMRRLMIRTNKKHIKTIPPLHIKSVMLPFSEDSTKSYNDLVMVVSRNLITSDWFSEFHAESLLNQKNSNECGLVLENLRRSCCFGAIMNMKVEKSDLIECLDKLFFWSRSKDCGALPHVRAKDRVQHIYSVKLGGQIESPPDAARRILLGHRIPLIHVPKEKPIFDRADQYITIAPEVPRNNRGMHNLSLVMQYRGRLKHVAESFMYGGKCERCSTDSQLPFVTPCCHIVCNQCMIYCREKCPVENCGTPYALDADGVPEELIELQPAINSLTWGSNWDKTKSSKIEYLMKKLEEISTVTESVNGVQVTRRKKVIVYSQYDEHLMLTAIELKRSVSLRDSYSELFSNVTDISTGRRQNLDKYLDEQLRQFHKNPDVFILLMGKERGSVGLDLSYVEHMFLLEPFWDAALEKQVVSRAHRMGAKDPVYVERLVMKDSVEADMLEFYNKSRNDGSANEQNQASGVGKVKTQQEYLKRKNILLRLNYVQSGAQVEIEKENAKRGSVSSSTPSRVAHPIQAGYASRQSTQKIADTKSGELHMKRPREGKREGRKVKRRISFMSS